MDLIWVLVIKPSFSTLFRGSENSLVTYEIEFIGDGVPVFLLEFSSK